MFVILALALLVNRREIVDFVYLTDRILFAFSGLGNAEIKQTQTVNK